MTHYLTSGLANFSQCERFGRLSDWRYHMTDVCMFYLILLHPSKPQHLFMPHRVQRGIGDGLQAILGLSPKKASA